MTDTTSRTAAAQPLHLRSPAIRRFQASQTSAETFDGHIFGNTVVQDNASAYLGDLHTTVTSTTQPVKQNL